MAGYIDAKGGLLFGEALLVGPGTHLNILERCFEITVVAAEQADLIGGCLQLLGVFPCQANGCLKNRTIDTEAIKGAGADQRVNGTAVDLALVDPLGKIEQVLERTAFLACSDDSFDRALAGTLDRAETIADLHGLLARLADRRKTVVRQVDIGWQQTQAADIKCIFD